VSHQGFDTWQKKIFKKNSKKKLKIKKKLKKLKNPEADTWQGS